MPMTEAAAARLACRIDTPLGPMRCVADAASVRELGWHAAASELPMVVQLGRSRPAALLADVERQLGEYHAGVRRSFDLPLAFEGTEFQCSVWRALCEIPYGETWSYGQVAQRIARPRAVRAVGLANGANRIAIIVPCHRVVNTGGALGGYSSGLERKRYLLELERRSG